MVGPDTVVTAGTLRARSGSGYAATLVVSGYPAEVGMTWLEPVLAWAGRFDVALHIEPVPTEVAAGRLRRQRARLESSRRLDADRGRLDDPLIEAAADDAADLADRLARGEARLFRVGLYLTVHAPTRALLADAVAEVRAAAASVLLDTHPATWRQLAGWCSTLPLGHDGLDQRRVMDTDALAAAFPLACPDLPGPLPGEAAPSGGVLYGVNTTSGGIVWWDRWAQDNHNAVVLARSGAGKSYLVKLDVLRQLYAGVHAAVIDPEDEYTALAAAVDGTVVRLGAPGVRINPFDLPTAAPPPRRPDPAGAVPAHPDRRAPRRTAAPARTGRPRQGPHRHLHRRRHHPRPVHLDPARARPGRPRRHPDPARRDRPGRRDPRRPAVALGRRIVQGPVRRTHHHPTHRAPRGLVHPAPARRDSAPPGCCSPSTRSGATSTTPARHPAQPAQRDRHGVPVGQPVGSGTAAATQPVGYRTRSCPRHPTGHDPTARRCGGWSWSTRPGR